MNFHQNTIAHVTSITLNVKDMATQVDFYTHMLGLEVAQMTADETILNIGQGGHQLILKQLVDGRKASVTEAGLFHIALLLPDEVAVGRLLRHLLEQQVVVSGGDHLVSQAIYFADPEGNGIEVYADRDSETWSWEGNQVVMDTLALDGDRLLQISNGTRWEGMPNDAKIGHLHLKTSDVTASMLFFKQFGFVPVAKLPGGVFMSDASYHHHIAVNTWQSRQVRHDAATTYGLASFNIMSAERGVETLTTPDGIEMTVNQGHANRSSLEHDLTV
ncbi:VOC family protein [Staphylococcus rostri]|uniref:Glyoxalase n=1 Tax=Staphylococcus rostri TaxID=522262 RepID=A0A2K3YKL4_9STAP|nr:VOC family protein [Staphylococcus rostri]PNZ25854.1 glyoxalase [Staphylococcus rostri]